MASHSGIRAAYIATLLAFLYALVSFYWGAGGTADLSTVGGRIEELARERDTVLLVVVWITGAMKVFAGLISLVIARRSDLRIPRWVLLSLGWAGAAVLTVYGAVMEIAMALALSGVLGGEGDLDRRAFWGHFLIWDAWFLVWGMVLGYATLTYQWTTSDQL